jgi:glycosyltransferase involved in cell wall biosynthesis
LVFAEAASFGVPSLAIQTGGVPTLVQNGQTGNLFKLEDNPAQWAKTISELLKDSNRYPQMAMAAYEHYRKILNWKAASHRLRIMIERLVG